MRLLLAPWALSLTLGGSCFAAESLTLHAAQAAAREAARQALARLTSAEPAMQPGEIYCPKARPDDRGETSVLLKWQQEPSENNAFTAYFRPDFTQSTYRNPLTVDLVGGYTIHLVEVIHTSPWAAKNGCALIAAVAWYWAGYEGHAYVSPEGTAFPQTHPLGALKGDAQRHVGNAVVESEKHDPAALRDLMFEIRWLNEQKGVLQFYQNLELIERVYKGTEGEGRGEKIFPFITQRLSNSLDGYDIPMTPGQAPPLKPMPRPETEGEPAVPIRF